MIGLDGIALLAGLIIGVSPCVLPVLPVVFAGWATPPSDPAHGLRARRRRALAVVSGLAVCFVAQLLFAAEVLHDLGLPENLLMKISLGLIVVVGVALLIPPLERLVERPFRRLGRHVPSATAPAFLLGLGLGGVFTPCAGPVLTAIDVRTAQHAVDFDTVIVALCLALGAVTPMLVIALSGDQLVERNKRLRVNSRRWRPVAGAILVLLALALNFNWLNPIQRWLPGYVNTLQTKLEQSPYASSALDQFKTVGKGPTGPAAQSLASCVSYYTNDPGTALVRNCGPAPAPKEITAWLNTPDDQPINWSSLKGHVTLVDFWTYSCINCQRALPHVEAWYARYHQDGFNVIGMQSPEFAFEHVVSNVRQAIGQLGIKYPVAVDNQLATFIAYQNNVWPADYLINAQGQVAYCAFGEGAYGETETVIRELLAQADPGRALPSRTDVPDLTPNVPTSLETHLGYEWEAPPSNESFAPGTTRTYRLPTQAPASSYATEDPAYSYALGGTWTSESQYLKSVSQSQLTMAFVAKDVYLVLGGSGTITVQVGSTKDTVTVSGYPRLYQLVSAPNTESATLLLTFTPGVDAYCFTYG